MGVIGFRRGGVLTTTLSVVTVLLVVHCEGHTVETGKSEKVLILNDWDNIDWDWAGTSLAIYPAVFVLIAAIIIPIALVAIILFAIPLLTPSESAHGRSIDQFIAPTWRSIDEATEKFLNASQCMERISCEASKLATRYSRSWTNRLHRRFLRTTWLSSGIKTRLARAFDNAKNEHNCGIFQCEMPTGIGSKGRSLTDVDMTDMFDPSEWWNKFVYYFGGRFIWVRKLQANQGVDFYPYLPSNG